MSLGILDRPLVEHLAILDTDKFYSFRIKLVVPGELRPDAGKVLFPVTVCS